MTPEKKVESLVWAKAFQLGMSLEVYDSRGTYSEGRKSYTTNLGLNNGTPDLLGCDRHGNFVGIELKAQGHRGLCSLDQWNFLRKKIDHKAFCLVCDCEKYLENVYNHWLSLDSDSRKKYLLELLPKKVYVTQVILKKKVRKIIAAPAI